MTEYLRNPEGAVHDVEDTHPGVELAKKGDGGWHFATAAEVKEYAKANGIKDVPDLSSRASDVKKAAAEGEEIKAQEIAVADEAAAAVDSKA